MGGACVAWKVAASPAVAADGFHRVALHHPVADIDDVNILLHDDVAGKNAVVDPIAEALLGRSGVRPRRTIDIAREVMSFTTDDVAQRTAMDAADHFHKRGAIADLESYVKA